LFFEKEGNTRDINIFCNLLYTFCGAENPCGSKAEGGKLFHFHQLPVPLSPTFCSTFTNFLFHFHQLFILKIPKKRFTAFYARSEVLSRLKENEIPALRQQSGNGNQP
jgi:hypothetical protein